MKKIKKLSLSAENIRSLTNSEVKAAAGGISGASGCASCVPEDCYHSEYSCNCTWFGDCTYPTNRYC